MSEGVSVRKLVPLFILLGLWVHLNAGLPGDIDDGGSVGLEDVYFIASQWLGIPADSNNADIAPFPDGDGMVNFLDFSVVADHWLLSSPDSNEMIFISGGQFQMGDNFGDSIDPVFPDPNNSDELPLHDVTIDPFYMGKYEITNDQYCTFLNSMFATNAIYLSADVVYEADNDKVYCDTSASSAFSQIAFADGVFSVQWKGSPPDDRDMSDDPMVTVSWYGAAAYCNWRSQQDGYEACYDTNDPNWPCDFAKKGYRLPTEAQWEYAARGGYSGRRFSWDDPNTISHSLANYISAWELNLYYDISPSEGFHPDWDDINPYTSPVGSFSPNGFGLYDMTGNAWEWCNDWYDEGYYDNSAENNPTGPVSSPNGDRVRRGGSWNKPADECRVACRSARGPEKRYSGIGFRICLNLN